MMDPDHRQNRPEYFHMVETVRSKYSHLLGSSNEVATSLVGDIVEAWEDLVHIVPALRGIVAGDFSDEQVKDAFCTLSVRLWHTIGHLQGIDRALSEIEDQA